MTQQATTQSPMTGSSSPEPGCGAAGICSCPVLPAFTLLLRLGLGGLFLIAAYHKLFESDNAAQLFSESVKAFHAFDFAGSDTQGRFIQAATFMTPWVEIVAGIALIVGIWTRAAAAVLAALLILFIGLIVQAMARHLSLECGCFGSLSPFCPKKIGPCNIIQNSIMLAAALAIVLTPRHILTLDSLFNRKDRAGCRKD